MNIYRKTAKNFAIASFILAIIDLIIVAIKALELLATTCQYPDIVKTYSEFKVKKNIWKTLAILGISIHLLVSIAILIQIQYRTFF